MQKVLTYLVGLVARPLLMQTVQTYAVCALPSNITFCFCKLGLKLLFVLMLEWL